MLRPDARNHLSELMRPPLGYALDGAVGTTFSLDLLAALTVPLSFAAHDWSDDTGEARDPLAALEAIYRHSERLTIFCEGGRIKAPEQYRKLITWLEEVVCEVRAPNKEGVFHPKVWVLRFTHDEQPVRYRVLCLSRNLSFDRSWDTALSLDGVLADRTLGITRNHPLADFVEALPGLARKSLPGPRRTLIRKIADELRRVNFELPEGFEDCRFWHGGIKGGFSTKSWEEGTKALIVAPFISDGVIRKLTEETRVYLVSRPDQLQALAPETLEGCEAAYALDPSASQPGAIEEAAMGQATEEQLSGLHAKLFVVDKGRKTSVFTGSFNATHHALQHNVEFMVELVGSRSVFGVDEFLRHSDKGMKFLDLLTPFCRAADEPKDADKEEAEKRFRAAKRELLDANPTLTVRPGAHAGYFDAELSFGGALSLPEGLIVSCRPISLEVHSARALDQASFSNLPVDRISPWVAFDLKVSLGGAEHSCTFVTKAALAGAPADRAQRVFAALLADRENLSRFLLLLLSNGDPSGEATADAMEFLREGSAAMGKGGPAAPSLFETMLRALAKQPSQIDRIEKVIRDLKASGEGSALLDDEFQSVWEPIWSVRQASNSSR